MRQGRMFVSQRRMNEVILYCILADVVLAYILKRFEGQATTAPLVLLYILNIVVLAGVYRFWKFPVFSWDEAGFVFLGISPFKRDAGTWKSVEAAGFKAIETKKGRKRECLLVVYTTPAGLRKTGVVPMGLVGFREEVKAELEKFMKYKGIKSV